MKALYGALLGATSTALALLSPGALADPAASDEPADFQVFLGVLELDDQSGEWDEISDGDVDVDFSTLPAGGIEAEYVFYQGWVHAGLNPGGSIAWKNDDTKFAGGVNQQGGTLIVELDNSLFLFELHLGGYVRGRLHERVTAYAAAGPMLMYGSHDVEDESVEPAGDDLDLSETDASDFNIGYYARAGVDFQIRDNQHLGFGVRYLSTELDFDDTIGEIDIEGPEWVLTWTQRL